jgi:predicted Zn-ribbon and HTH transcriptional regulator
MTGKIIVGFVCFILGAVFGIIIMCLLKSESINSINAKANVKGDGNMVAQNIHIKGSDEVVCSNCGYHHSDGSELIQGYICPNCRCEIEECM